MNKIIKLMAKRQNPKRKLNAGQLRESVSLFILAVKELSLENKNLSDVDSILIDKLSQSVKK